jgi:crotonobetainyl-CoA:carnitine CoA-transferase CaiB-like acyl-CoA transferase
MAGERKTKSKPRTRASAAKGAKKAAKKAAKSKVWVAGGKGPLAGIKVLDLTHARAGPTCVRQLADWGADVIKVEMPTKGDDDVAGRRHGSDFQNLHRNKRSLSLNLKHPEALAIFKKLAKDADVVVENFRPDVKHRLGVDDRKLRRLNPRLIYASISGFGQTGPYRDRPGVDQIAQGMGGLMSITGLPGQGPVRVGIPIADLTAGILLAYGVVMALYERERSGKGQWTHTSLLQAMIQMLDFQAARWLIGKEVPPQAGNDHPTGIPTGVFPTEDGHINIAASNNRMFARLCTVLGTPQWTTDPDFSHDKVRSKNRAKLNAAIGEVTRTRPSHHWIDVLNAAGVPSGPIYSVDRTFADPQVKSLGQVKVVRHKALGDLDLVGQAAALTRTPWSLRRPAPDTGQHTGEVLKALGYSEKDVHRLREAGAV